MPKHPLAEVFGFPINNFSSDADRYRNNKLCPFNNKVPSCTKDKAEKPIEQSFHIVNVASVPHRSPFRYPGGKTWLIPYIRRWLSLPTRQKLNSTHLSSRQIVEPFAGGGIVSLTAVAEKLVSRGIMVEKDEDVAAVWLTILDGENYQWLTDMIMTYDDTKEVRDLANQFNFDVECIPMKNTHHTAMFELLIGPDLEWLRSTFIGTPTLR